ncbi:hypothetical protein HWV62_25683 [Athelia sp. TMB]|nr:hypothetical protein HWV62_44788 [Athelia sp. TMB]KAF7982781.1 hypothetical protein HWV62_25683 [Athelia sp. TMB]
MFTSLVRRISGSFLPRSDRPWPEDGEYRRVFLVPNAPTSTAPTIGRKRRLSTPVDEEEENTAKKARGNEGAATRDVSPVQMLVKETEEVTQVTQGVKEVELDETKPETVPLPLTPPPETSELDQAPAEVAEDSEDSTAQATFTDAEIDPAPPSAPTHSVVEEQDEAEPATDTTALSIKQPLPSASSETAEGETSLSTTAAEVPEAHQSDVQSDHGAADETENVPRTEKTEGGAF